MSLLEKYIKFINEADKVPGGLSDGMSIEDIAKKHGVDVDELKTKLEAGKKVEMEHTSDEKLAAEIAKDHLFEDPDYYEKLKTIEENSPTATLGSVNGMGSVALPGNPGTQGDYVTSETGSGDIPYNLTKGQPKKGKKKKMKKSFLTYNAYLKEEQVFGMFNDAQGKPTKLDKEILDIALGALPKNIINNIDDVEGSGARKSSGISPSSVSNKGQSRGEIEYTMINISFKEDMGRQKIKNLTVGLRKRTSGPGTGYLFMEVDGGWNRSMPETAAAIEFWMDNPSEQLKKLFDDRFANLFK
jgi:hypothetical protein